MGILRSLFNVKGEVNKPTKEELKEAGACPNCWGYSEYDTTFNEYVKDKTKDNINHDHLHLKTFINQFVETNVTGIQLKKEGSKMVCPACVIKKKTNAV